MKKKTKSILVKISMIIVLCFFLGFYSVNAEEAKVTLENIKIIEKSPNVEATIEKQDQDYNFDITFHRQNDYVLYQITLKNQNDIDYFIKSIKHNSSSENLEFELDQKDETFQTGTTKNIKVKVIYKTLADTAEKRIQRGDVSFALVFTDENGNESELLINPLTSNKTLMIMIIVILSIIGIILIAKKKKGLNVILLLLLIYPTVILAQTISYSLKINYYFKLYDKVALTIDNGDNSEITWIDYGTDVEEIEEPTKEGYTLEGWYTDPNFENKVDDKTKIVDNITYYPKWEPKKITCEAGKYLPNSSENCTECPEGNYCPGGEYNYNTDTDQGKEECTVGSYSRSGSAACTACSNGKTTSGTGQTSCNAYCSNRGETSSWKTVTWNDDNTINNLCIINSCRNVTTGIYELNNNKCTATGSIYASGVSVKDNAEYKNSIYSSALNINNYNVPEAGNKSKTFYKIDLVNSIVAARYICFTINSGMNLSGVNIGNYCLKATAGEEAYQENIRELKRAFGNNNTVCTDTGTKYDCKNYTNWTSNGSYHYYVTKGGESYVMYDEPVDGKGQPYCYLTPQESRCGNNGCLDGETEVVVYDKKKKKKRRKKLKDVTKDDLILCWDFDTGQFVYAEPLWIQKVEVMSCYYLLEFSDGSSLKVIGDHKLFDADNNRFVNAGADNELTIGSHVWNDKEETIELVSWQKIEEEIEAYNVITNYHMNLFANGILTSCIFSNLYTIENMKYVKDTTDRICKEDLEGMDNEYINGLRLVEVPIHWKGNKQSTISYIKQYVNHLISNKK